MSTHQVVAVDLGGSKLAIARVSAAGTLQDRWERPAPRTPREIAAAVAEYGAAPQVGCIVPGIYYASTGEVWAPNLFGADALPFREEMQQRLGVRVVLDSDRAGYVLGEQWMGVARGLSDVVFVSIGTGIGAGILSGGRLVRGAHDISGAVGWFALNPDWKEEYARCGCWEAEAAGPGIARNAGQPDAVAVAGAARAGDASALRVIERAAEYTAMGVANLISVLNPEMVVLGGGLMHAADLFFEPIRRRVANWAQPIACRRVRIEPTSLGDDAGLLGAARLALLP